MMSLAAKIDDIGKPAWIVLLILSFWAWWPLGLAFLFFMLWSRRMGCWGHRQDRWNDKIDRMQDKLDRMRARASEWGRSDQRWGGWGAGPSSGNRAFDEYREETLRRLEEEQREFKDFLDRLRHAKDKAEFDQFMADRRNRPPAPPMAEGEPAR